MADPALPGKRVVKRFRVAREGQTIDGRTLSQEQIIDMSETYDPVEYTARINCEHMSGYWRDISASTALGDIIKVDHAVETFVQNGSNVQLMCLYATLSVLPTLVEANKEGKKVFTSIEFYPKFADTGRAYLVGLAVTDRPASRGIEPLKFNTDNTGALRTDPNDQELILMTKNAPAPKTTDNPADDANTADQPVVQNDNQENLNNQPESDGFLQKLSNMFASKKSGMSQEEQDLVLQSFSKVNEKADKAVAENTTLKTELSSLKTEFDALKTQLSTEPATNLTPTPPTTGSGPQLTRY